MLLSRVDVGPEAGAWSLWDMGIGGLGGGGGDHGSHSSVCPHRTHNKE